MARVAVAMSGGVDSSVAAALLVQAGHEVVGFTLNLWPVWLPEDGNPHACCGVGAAEDARAVAQQLGIRHYVLNLREAFEEAVIRPFAEAYARGRTPNPCVACNRSVKFSLLLDRARGLGMDFLATGHYARTRRDGQVVRLLRALDPRKDQSYVLCGLSQRELSHVLFPLGELTKDRVRSVARELGLVVADKPESQEICFVPRGHYTEVVARFAPHALRPGPLYDLHGRRLGTHQGVARYTLGQRRGLRCGGRPAVVRGGPGPGPQRGVRGDRGGRAGHGAGGGGRHVDGKPAGGVQAPGGGAGPARRPPGPGLAGGRGGGAGPV
jgi:tRNA-specific 2-thiouridylase